MLIYITPEKKVTHVGSYCVSCFGQNVFIYVLRGDIFTKNQKNVGFLLTKNVNECIMYKGRN